jgi:hypothetical protein
MSNKKILEKLEKELQEIKQDLKKEIKEDFEKYEKKKEKILKFGEIINLLDDKTDHTDYSILNKSLKKRIQESKNSSFEDLAVTYYYLVRNNLKRNTLIEDNELQKNFENFILFAYKHKDFLFNKIKIDIKNNKIIKLQTIAFLKTIQKYLHILEKEFEKKHFFDLLSKSYKNRMYYRKQIFYLKKEYFRYFGYKIWSLTSHYGENFFRWGLTSISFIVVFSLFFYLLGYFEYLPYTKDGLVLINETTKTTDILGYTNHPMLYNHTYTALPLLDYLYFSVITFTTLGYGDILPITPLEKGLTIIAVLLGYVMLGIFMTLLSRKFSS